MSPPTAGRIFRFGPFELREAEGELRKHGVRVKLHSQPFQLLLLLLERPSELVSRDAVRERLWDRDTFVDFDHGLNTAVNKVRQALRDSASEPRFIETVPGKGYRLITPVVVVTAPHAEIDGEQTHPADSAAQTAAEHQPQSRLEKLLASPQELPSASRPVVRTLLLLEQALYLSFYVSALANLGEIDRILTEWRTAAPDFVLALVMVTAVGLIPVRLFLSAAICFDAPRLRSKFAKLFPLLLALDLLWALSPFLLVHHVNLGVALAMSAALVYLPFTQRSLIMMYAPRPK